MVVWGSRYWKNRRFFPWSPSRLGPKERSAPNNLKPPRNWENARDWKTPTTPEGEPTGVGKARGFPSSLRNNPTKIGEKPTASPRDTCQMLELMFSCNKISFWKAGPKRLGPHRNSQVEAHGHPPASRFRLPSLVKAERLMVDVHRYIYHTWESY